MPVVISMLNAFTGLSAAGAGFVLDNTALIIAGSLVGSSGTLLTILMGRAMNRSLANVLFGAFGAHAPGAPGAAGDGGGGTVREATPTDVAAMLAYADQRDRGARVRARGRPGAAHGARAGRRAREAGRRGELRDPPRRRPHAGHMNVLLAEADVPYRGAEGDGRDQPRVPARPTWRS